MMKRPPPVQTLADFTSRGALAVMATRDDSDVVLFEGDVSLTEQLNETLDYSLRIHAPHLKVRLDDIHLVVAWHHDVRMVAAHAPGHAIMRSLNRMFRNVAKNIRKNWGAG